MRDFQVIRNGMVLQFDEESDGGYTVTVPEMPGCVSFGETFEEALEMIKDAMAGWLEVAKEEGIPIPRQLETDRIASI